MPSDFSEFIKREGFEELKNTLREISSENDEIKLFMKSFQIISGVAFPVLLGKQMEKLSGIDYADEGIRYKYLEVLLKTIVEE
jgi:hypothetical protein